MGVPETAIVLAAGQGKRCGPYRRSPRNHLSRWAGDR